MAIIKEQDIVLVSKEPDGTKVIQMPITRVENVEKAVATVNGIKPDSSKNITLDRVTYANSAVKAAQDIDGNTFSITYAKKSDLTEGLNSKLSTSEANRLYATKFEINKKINSNGDRGVIGGFEAVATSNVVQASSPDSQNMSSDVTVLSGENNQVWTKIVYLKAGNIRLNSGWTWVNNKTPVIKHPCLLVCHWSAGAGIASLVYGVA